MKKSDWTGVLIIVGIIIIGLIGGGSQKSGGGLASMFKVATSSVNTTTTDAQKQSDIERQLNESKLKADELQRQIDEENRKKTESKYKGIVNLTYVFHSTDPTQEYVGIRVVGLNTEPINVTGWKLVSSLGGTSVTIPKGTYLFFTGMQNVEEDIYLKSGDTLYLITGISPNGASFKLNKCSGYLTQFQTFTPYIYVNCPLPRDEDQSSIPHTLINQDCLNYIESFSSCRIQTEPLPTNWTYECKNFIYNKLNYPSCVDTHKNDKDFYQNEWRVYLKRSEKIWLDRRDTITLYDLDGKVVSTLTYY